MKKLKTASAASESRKTNDTRDELLEKAKVLIGRTYSEAVELVGSESAHQIWNEMVANRKRKRGRPPKNELSGWDILLLVTYDELINDPNPQTLPRHMGRFFHERKPTKYHSARAVEQKIRRLVAERDAGKLIKVERPGMALPLYIRRQQ